VKRRVRRSVRRAARMMVVMISCYLAGSFPNMIVTCLEQVDRQLLVRHGVFYLFCTDVITLMTVLVCFLRLPIYYCFNPSIRHDVKFVLGLLDTRRDSLL